jgi:hypothetical protein
VGTSTAVGLPDSPSALGAGLSLWGPSSGSGVLAAVQPLVGSGSSWISRLLTVVLCGVCCLSSYRPVLKHGPRSLTCTRVVESEKLEREMNVKVFFRELTGDPRCFCPPRVGRPWRSPGAPRLLDCRSGAPRAYTLGPERW